MAIGSMAPHACAWLDCCALCVILQTVLVVSLSSVTKAAPRTIELGAVMSGGELSYDVMSEPMEAAGCHCGIAALLLHCVCASARGAPVVGRCEGRAAEHIVATCSRTTI